MLTVLLLPALAANAQLSKKQEKLNAQHAAAIADAKTAAEGWIKIQDTADYEKSWAASSDYFRSQVPVKGWVRRMEEVRKPLDPVLTRELSASEWKEEIPNLPKGEYVALVYETVFSAGRAQPETVVMVHEGGGWKMVGYAVQ
jgi:hypothetical protein